MIHASLCLYSNGDSWHIELSPHQKKEDVKQLRFHNNLTSQFSYSRGGAPSIYACGMEQIDLGLEIFLNYKMLVVKCGLLMLCLDNYRFLSSVNIIGFCVADVVTAWNTSFLRIYQIWNTASFICVPFNLYPPVGATTCSILLTY